jgi:glycosyltransferase involved in cell wall biosynthesis
MISSNETGISVVIPVHNGGINFRACLLSLRAADPPPHEIIVVSDGDSGGSGRLAEKFGAEVLRNPNPEGPARARNMGARHAKGDILFFVDADVTIQPDAMDRVAAAFQNDTALAAIFGSYDDEPFETNFLSQYKNLFHHYVHHTAKREASTFWGAGGAIRRDLFLMMGGFNEGYRRLMRKSTPGTSEDIELGYRLKKSGYKIELIKELTVKHLKRWTVLGLLKADIFYRAVPWTRLILCEGRFLNDLNTKISGRISVLCIGLATIVIPASWFAPWCIVPAAILLGTVFWLNRDLYRFFRNKRGPGFALKAIFWHWLYLFYSGLTFAVLWAHHNAKKVWVGACKSVRNTGGQDE